MVSGNIIRTKILVETNFDLLFFISPFKNVASVYTLCQRKRLFKKCWEHFSYHVFRCNVILQLFLTVNTCKLSTFGLVSQFNKYFKPKISCMFSQLFLRS